MGLEYNFLLEHLPDQKKGDWAIETFGIKANDWVAIRSMMKGRPIDAGKYRRLMYKREVIMSTTPAEQDDFTDFVEMAEGRVLINGLGLGCLVKHLLDKPEITYIKVIEKHSEVIDLVAPYLIDPRLEIIHADAFTYEPTPDDRFDYGWHDIWDNICSENIPQMDELEAKWEDYIDCYQESWLYDRCLEQSIAYY